MDKKAIFILITLLSTLALSSCGSSGGGGGGSGASATTCVWDNASSTWDNCTWGP